ncbi:MAG: LamG domain-containing protein [bacterium]
MNHPRFLFAILFICIAMATGILAIQPNAATWPGNTDRVLFLWENAKLPVRVQHYDGTAVFQRFYAPTARGLSAYDHNYAMWLHGGAYIAEEIAAPLADAFRESSQFSMEITIKPANITQTGAVIAAMASDSGQNMQLRQEKNMLVLNFITSLETVTIPLCPVVGGEFYHIVIIYKSGKLSCYKNGKLVFMNDKIQGDLKSWKNQPLVFGNDANLKHPWLGKLEGIGLYAREISAGEVQQNYTAYQKKIKSRKAIPQLIIQAKLLKCSDIQSPKAILPYTQALGMYEYAVEKVIAGKYTAKKIRVAHWVVLDKQLLSLATLPVNKSYRLVLEPFDDNPQLEASLMNDTLPFDVEVGQYFDVCPPK